ncbi:MAG TPA: nuclear transport factor 2 family protein [Woeseiaceae bacterium]|nr:nuclear transport factor 2 family protein [Woeseiaceae bacterium]
MPRSDRRETAFPRVAAGAAWWWLLALVAAIVPGSLRADDNAALQALLDEFLANVASVEMHERFWADDLVYTSSSGTRTTKSAILADMRAAPEPAAGAGSDESPAYAAEDVDIRVFGDAAVVAFRLVAEPGVDGAARTEYFNTGTFLERDGRWQAVAWQATRIPPPVPESGD